MAILKTGPNIARIQCDNCNFAYSPANCYTKGKILAYLKLGKLVGWGWNLRVMFNVNGKPVYSDNTVPIQSRYKTYCPDCVPKIEPPPKTKIDEYWYRCLQ